MNVLICLNPFLSHYIPTIVMATRMKELGHNVIYIGFSDMQSRVKSDGFEYYPIITCNNNDLVKLQKQHEYGMLERLYYELHTEIEEIMKICQTDLVLIGVSRFTIYLPVAFSMNKKVVLYSLCAGIPYFNTITPPVTSSYIPNGKKSIDIKSIFYWILRFLRKGLSPSILQWRFYYPWTSLKKQCKERGIKWKFGIDGFFPDFPIFSFGSVYFEFNQVTNPIYAGLSINCIDNEQKSEIYLPFTRKDNPIIYCCLGTMRKRYINAEAFINAVIEVFKLNPQWNLVLSLGKEGDSLSTEVLSENIYIIDYINQQSILQKANLMLTHAGYGTVKECIFYGVPMIACSCSYDQHGNAARVKKNRIGISSSIMKKTVQQKVFHKGVKNIKPASIKKLIEEALYNTNYHDNICELRCKIITDNELNNTIQFLESIIYNK